jgi:hypothetical protein
VAHATVTLLTAEPKNAGAGEQENIENANWSDSPMKNISAFLIVLIASATGTARIIMVDDDGPADFRNIQAAIDDANNGDTVEIQPGRYAGNGNRDIDFLGKAITVTGTDPSDPNVIAQTVIDCNGTETESHRGFDFHSGEGPLSVLRGLTITNGHAHGPGGAIRCDNGSSPTILSCIISNNISGVCRDGGGRRDGGRSLDCDTGYGGGICCGNLSNPLIENCVISNNTVIGAYVGDGGGGGIYCGNGNTSVIGCTISGNTATTGSGGGIACYSGGQVTISRCVITGNSANVAGGIVYVGSDGTITDCVIAGNTATEYGGGIYTTGHGIGTIMSNCTVVNNSAPSGGGLYVIFLSVYNSIIRGNTAPEGPQITVPTCMSELGARVIVEYSNVQGGRDGAYAPGCGEWGYKMETCIDLDPDFLDPANMDFRLRPDSWCVDAGTNEQAGDFDILGNPRIADGDGNDIAVVDMGAYEVVPSEVPVIMFSTPELHMSADQNDPEPQPQTGGIRNLGPGVMNWTLSADCPWLTFVPDAGASTSEGSEIAFNANVGGLAPGTYDCNLIITAPRAVNSPKFVPFKLHILGAEIRVPSQFPTIQDGIDHTSEGGCVIVADGLYTGSGNRNIDFKGKSITVRSENGPANCIIDCQGTYQYPQRAFHFKSGEDETSVIEGLTVTNASGPYRSEAIYCQESSPTIRNCWVINSAGGGILCEYEASPLISHCLISGNGGYAGITSRGGNPTIANCVISSSDRHMQRCGVCCYYGSATIRNCTIVANYEGGIDCGRQSEAVVENCIVWRNSIIDDRATRLEVRYSNVQGGYEGEGNIDADPCFVSLGRWEDPCNTRNRYSDDMWVGGDYHLKSEGGRWDVNEGRWTMDEVTSPCIDAGDPMSPIGLEPFANGGRINMGAFGGTAEASKSYFGEPPCEIILASDINGDCVVDFADFRLMALHWLEDNNP